MSTNKFDSRNILNKKNSSYTLKFVFYKFRWCLNRLTYFLRSEPDFIIIGAQRSGTTSLYDFLVSHDEIRGAIKKEVHYFDNYFHKGYRWYRAHFPLKSKRKITIEASPYYSFHPHAIRRIRNYSSKVKLIFLLRNPVERSYSHYKWEKRQGYEKESFVNALLMEKERLAMDSNKLMNQSDYYSFNHQHYSYANRGFYLRQIKNLENYFSKSEFLVLQSEQLFQGNIESFRKLSEFLGVRELNIKKFKLTNHTNKSNMSIKERLDLTDIFNDEIDMLYSYLGEEFDWK